jgi:Sulfotransferase family
MMFKFQPVFVGGAPRTGTTVLHALICTSPLVNDYIAECSYFSAFMQPYAIGLGAFEQHTRAYFESRDAFRDFHTSVMERVLEDIWMKTLQPDILALKDPMLTVNFHVLAQLLPAAKFVVAVRDPRDAVLSVVRGLRSVHKESTDKERLQVACAQYTTIYRVLLDNRASFADRLLFIDYNLLARGGEVDKLTDFGIDGISPQKLWQSEITTMTRDGNGDPWWSPLYGQRISTAAVGRYAGVLEPWMIDMIREQCGEVSAQLGAAMN